ncbi:MAG: DUF2231 domain-containing protein [Myxococcaceae bacterium]
MSMPLHALHPALVHLPLAFIPTAAAVDTYAFATGDKRWESAGRQLWFAGVGAAVLAGVTGLAAAREVRLRDPMTADMVFVHGSGNLLVTLGAAAVLAYRLFNRPAAGQVITGVTLVGTILYTAGLGGKMVYERGVGAGQFGSTQRILSPSAPGRLMADAWAGLKWIAKRAVQAITRAQPLARGAMGRAHVHRGILGSRPPAYVH